MRITKRFWRRRTRCWGSRCERRKGFKVWVVCWCVGWFVSRVSTIDSLRRENSISNQDYRCTCTTGTTTGVHMGSTRHDDDSCPSTVQTACNQRIGLATSIDPNGPFTRLDTPILQPGPVPSWDDQFTTNPTPHVFPNGSVLLLYKARSKENYNVMSTGVAFAQHWSGPYERMSAHPIQVPGTCEDAGM